MSNTTTKTVSTITDAQRAASKAAVAEYVKGKAVRDLIKSPVVPYTYTVDGQTIKAIARIDALRYVDSAETRKAIRDKAQYIAQQVAFVQQELGKDAPKVHRKAMLSALADVTGLLGLDDVKFGNRDAAFIVATCTRGKRASGSATTDLAVSGSAWRAVLSLLTNKLNAYDAKLLIGKNEYSVQATENEQPAQDTTAA